MNAYLRLSDGRYLACYLWSSKTPLWTNDVRKAWWGSLDTAYKIQDQWGMSSPFVVAIEKGAHLAHLLETAKHELAAHKNIDMSTITNETEYAAAEFRRRKAYQAYADIVCTIDDVGDE